jgi:hypothetical protein
MKMALATFALSLLINSISGQIKTPLDSLLLAVDSLVLQRKLCDLNELKAKSKYNFLNYMPSLGYDFLNNRPLITYNVSEIARLMNDKQKKKFEVSSLEQRSNVDLQKLHKNISILYYRLSDLFSLYYIELEIYKYNSELYTFDLKRYRNNEITLEEFFKSEILILEKRKELLSIKDQIYLGIIDLESLTNYSLNYEIKDFSAGSDSTNYVH